VFVFCSFFILAIGSQNDEGVSGHDSYWKLNRRCV
jgi:hypothetical protein